MPVYDRFYIVKDKLGWSFGYVGQFEKATDPDEPYELWATIDSETWVLTFAKDGRMLECESFEEIHDMLFEMMETDDRPRHFVERRTDGSQSVVAAPDLREQWVELGLMAKEAFLGVTE